MVAFSLVEALSFVEDQIDDAESVGLVASLFWGAESHDELRCIGQRFARDPLRKELSAVDIAALRSVYAVCDRILSYPCDQRDYFPGVTDGERVEVAEGFAFGKMPDLWIV
jgi:hypothetical protein